MAMHVFGYGSLLWKTEFNYDERIVGFIKGYRRVFYQGSTDHRGTPSNPGRTVTLEPAEGQICWGVAYTISDKENQKEAINLLEVRENQYDQKLSVDFYTICGGTSPELSNVLVYVGSPDREKNPNYLGAGSVEEIAMQIVGAEGPSGTNREYLFHLERDLREMGVEDEHVFRLADEARRIISES